MLPLKLGRRRIKPGLTTKQVNALNYAFAITAHKAKGSQFTRFIVPIVQPLLLDQALIYTLVTRGVGQVVLVGDEQVALAAIRAPASAARRHLDLPLLLKTSLGVSAGRCQLS